MIDNPSKWVITGVAGFIGSNILESLLKNDQEVSGLDNFATGHKSNLIEVKDRVSSKQWNRFNFFEGDIADYDMCKKIIKGNDYVLHQAALGSVPRSIEDPILTNEYNINGFINIINASKEANVKSFVYAASSSTYGDSEQLPKVEEFIGKPLSPYAVTKYVNELYADVFSKCYGLRTIGLRYFNVFGRRQDPDGAYAAVIPLWIKQMIKGKEVFINGNGETTRDFSHVDNIVKANIIAAQSELKNKSEVFNIGCGGRTSLIQLFNYIKNSLEKNQIKYDKDVLFRDFRDGDVLHSQASIEKASNLLNYEPKIDVISGLEKTMPWYIKNL